MSVTMNAMTPDAIDEALAGLDRERMRRARVLLGGRWSDLQYDEDVQSLPAIIALALGPAPVSSEEAVMLPVLWGWGSGAHAGFLVLHQVEGVIDGPALDANPLQRAE